MFDNINPYLKTIIFLAFICIFPLLFKASYLSIFSFSFMEKGLIALLIGLPIYKVFEHKVPLEQKKKIDHYFSDNVVIFLLLFFTFLVNFTCLFEKWASGDITSHSFNTIAGILPFKDANGVASGAKDLVEFGNLNSATSRRPIAALCYSFLLSITNQNLFNTLMIVAVLVSSSIFFVGKALYHYFGVIAAVVGIIMLSYFYLPFNGTLLTEPIGLMYGNISMALFLIAFYEKKANLFLLGLFVLTIGISARAGAFFAVPAIILYATYHFRDKHFVNFKLGAISLVLVFIALNMAPLLLKVVGPQEGYVYQGNFSYKLYGMVVGGEEWDYILKKHPEISDLPMQERPDYIYSLTSQAFKANPFGIVKSIFKDIWFIITNPFAFLWNLKSQFLCNKYFFLVPAVFFFLQFYKFKLSEKSAISLFLLFGLLGVIASYPFVSGSGGYRVFAATIAINFSIIAIGASFMVSKIKEYVAEES